MDDMYGFHSSSSTSTEGHPYYVPPAAPPSRKADFEAFGSSWSSISVSAASSNVAAAAHNNSNSILMSRSSSLEEESSISIREKISSHPLYVKLLEAYIDCQKVGAPPETSNMLDEILQENDLCRNKTPSYCHGEDPELDDFMETYCDVLSNYKLDLARPYIEATTFLKNMETQLSLLSINTPQVLDEAAKPSNEERSNGELQIMQEKDYNRISEVSEVKEKLLSKYSGYISSLRHEFHKEKKKGKLPKDARQILLNWWTVHVTWPYPTEEDKMALASSTGLDQKQINNWFINQRKRHWKPPENMQYSAVMSNNHYGSFFLNVD